MSGSELPASASAERLLEARVEAVKRRPPVDLRFAGRHVMDQGERPLCVTFAVSTIHDTATSGGVIGTELCPEPLWSHCVAAGEATWEGTSFDAVRRALAADGQVELSKWPYNDQLGAGTEPPPASVSAPPWRTARLEFVGLARDGVEVGIEDLLAAGTAVALIIEVDDTFDVVGRDGVVFTPALDSLPGYYHAVAVMGAATIAGQRCLLIQNSWSRSWGFDGYAWLPTSFLIAFGEAAAVVV